MGCDKRSKLCFSHSITATLSSALIFYDALISAPRNIQHKTKKLNLPLPVLGVGCWVQVEWSPILHCHQIYWLPKDQGYIKLFITEMRKHAQLFQISQLHVVVCNKWARPQADRERQENMASLLWLR